MTAQHKRTPQYKRLFMLKPPPNPLKIFTSFLLNKKKIAAIAFKIFFEHCNLSKIKAVKMMHLT
jgi:hypothetical protein